jgi:hypothetical protein
MANSEQEGIPYTPAETDDVTSKDYEQAYTALQAFLDVDIHQIQTIDDLSDQASFVSDAMRNIVIGAGHLEEQEYEYSASVADLEADLKQKKRYSFWVIRKPFADHHIFATADKEMGVITDYSEDEEMHSGMSRYRVSFPAKTFKDVRGTDEYFKSIPEAHADRSPIFFHAYEWRYGWRGEEQRQYYPAAERTNPVVQQGYARILQTGIRDILIVLPEPSEPELQIRL